jgi:hypothetical protein
VGALQVPRLKQRVARLLCRPLAAAAAEGAAEGAAAGVTELVLQLPPFRSPSTPTQPASWDSGQHRFCAGRRSSCHCCYHCHCCCGKLSCRCCPHTQLPHLKSPSNPTKPAGLYSGQQCSCEVAAAAATAAVHTQLPHLKSPSKPTKPASLKSGKYGFLCRLLHQFQALVRRPSMQLPASKKFCRAGNTPTRDV